MLNIKLCFVLKAKLGVLWQSQLSLRFSNKLTPTPAYICHCTCAYSANVGYKVQSVECVEHDNFFALSPFNEN